MLISEGHYAGRYRGGTYRLGLPHKELVVGLVHERKVVHSCQEYVHLDNILEAATGRFQNCRQVSQRLSLASTSAPGPTVFRKLRLAVRSLTVPPTSSDVVGAMPMLPEQ